MAYKLMREIPQPCMENGVEVYYPGQLLEMDAPAELGGRVVVVDVPGEPAPAKPATPQAPLPPEPVTELKASFKGK